MSQHFSYTEYPPDVDPVCDEHGLPLNAMGCCRQCANELRWEEENERAIEAWKENR